MEIAECKGHWALITGASSGIGREFAVQLAAAGVNIALVARRSALLTELAGTLSQQHGIRTLVAPADLREAQAMRTLREKLDAHGVRVRLLINNAAFGRWGCFEETSEATYRDMLRLNAEAMVALCQGFLPQLASFPTSAVINVSSAACYQPVPYMAVYAATKAFVQSFSQALHGEWRERGVHVQTLVPGPTETEFDKIAGAYESALKGRANPADVVKQSLLRLGDKSPVVVTTRGTYRQRIFAGLFPPKTVIATVARMFNPAKRHA